jgi:hypothetical protein
MTPSGAEHEADHAEEFVALDALFGKLIDRASVRGTFMQQTLLVLVERGVVEKLRSGGEVRLL